MKRFCNILAEAATLPSILDADKKVLYYILAATGFGGVAALTALLQKDNTPLRVRTVITYVLSGALASCVMVLLLIERYGASYFLTGIAFLSGYKAIDILANLTLALKRFILKKDDSHK